MILNTYVIVTAPAQHRANDSIESIERALIHHFPSLQTSMKSILKLVLMYDAARYLYNGHKTTLHDQVKEESTGLQGAQSEKGKSS